MKKLFSIALIGVLLVPVLLKILVLSNYALAYNDYLARCENKADVALQCNGLCQMSKELQATTQQREEAPEFPRVLQLEVLPFLLFDGLAAPHDLFVEAPLYGIPSADNLLVTFIDIPVPPPLFAV
ncbi:MAG: hypothetical protein LAT76_10685 [Schleiferiaceae bacterium]|nr:hypothetical protein [Schleiferiaceae bacterium]